MTAAGVTRVADVRTLVTPLRGLRAVQKATVMLRLTSGSRRLLRLALTLALLVLSGLFFSKPGHRRKLVSLQHDLHNAFVSTLLKSKDTAALVTIPLERPIFSDPPPVRLSDNIELVMVYGSITDQRSTWQEGGRPPYYVRFLLYENPKDHDAATKTPFLLRINATYPSHPSVDPVRCRPYSAHSNWWPVQEVMGYDGLYRLECDIPEPIANNRTGPPSSLSVRLDYNALFFSTEEEKEDLAQRVKDQGTAFEWPSIPEGYVPPSTQRLDLSTVQVAKTKYSLCLFPFWGYDNYVGDRKPLRFIEWRLYWQKLGVERVIWYAYEGEDRYLAFVKALIAVLGNQDEIHIVTRMPHPFLGYWDQALYYNHCGQIYRDASDYFVIVDLDEVLALEPSEYDDPAGALSRWIDSWDPDAGSYMMLRVDLGMPPEIFDLGRPSIESLAQDLWTSVNMEEDVVKGYHRKTLYRARSVEEIWTHHGTWMYPRPAPANESLPVQWEQWPKPYQDWGKSWKQIEWETPGTKPANYSEETWPRMWHYRWWGGTDTEFGEVPLPTHPHLVAFQEKMREEVYQVGDAVAARLGPSHLLANARKKKPT